MPVLHSSRTKSTSQLFAQWSPEVHWRFCGLISHQRVFICRKRECSDSPRRSRSSHFLPKMFLCFRLSHYRYFLRQFLLFYKCFQKKLRNGKKIFLVAPIHHHF